MGQDFGMGLATGFAGPYVNRVFGAAKGGMRTFLGHPAASSVASVSKGTTANSSSIWRWGPKAQWEGSGAKTIVKNSTKEAFEDLFKEKTYTWPIEAIQNNFKTGNDDSNNSSRTMVQGSGSQTQFQLSRPRRLGSPYVSQGSSLPRDSIRPLLKDGSHSFSGYTVQANASSMSSSYGGSAPTGSQSMAEVLNLNFRCSYAVSRDESQGRDHRGGSGTYELFKASLRAPPDWSM